MKIFYTAFYVGKRIEYVFYSYMYCLRLIVAPKEFTVVIQREIE